ncbi:MAG: hypothetical protein H6815_00420 [Phycisphaeraceae bacterium]|nr:hypothetical protein [Phycisphaerales bacterium]MCB9858888.1 hypothetical protein [Phycisphaeraceae bacterium]
MAPQKVISPVDNTSPDGIRQFMRSVAQVIDVQIRSVSQTASAEDTDVVTFTMQVVDRRGNAMKRQCLFRCFVRDESNAAASATITANTGELVTTVTAGRVFDVLSDSDGVIEVDLEVAGTAQRQIATVYLGDYTLGVIGTFA